MPATPRTSLVASRLLALALGLTASAGLGCAALFGESGSSLTQSVACPEFGSGKAMGVKYSGKAELDAQIGAFVQASADLKASVNAIEGEVAAACKRMGQDLGVDASKLEGNDDIGGKVKGPCNAVAAKIEQIVKANGSLQVSYKPPRCKVDGNFVAKCDAECGLEVDPGKVEASCQPGKVSGYCEGTCEGSCEGTCNGECEGTCSAKDAQGRCVGSCNGTCKGSCDATCHAECKGQWKAPKCDVAAKPPQAQADCSASCKASGEFKAACSKPEVVVQGDAKVEDLKKLQATLRTNLPALIKAQIRLGKQLGGQVKVVADAGGRLKGKLDGAGAKATACVAAAVSAMADVSAKVSVNVQVSASVSGKVGAKSG